MFTILRQNSLSILSSKFTLLFQAHKSHGSQYLKVRQKLYNRYNWTDSSFDVLRSLESVGVKFEITGLGELKKVEGPAVIIGNHMSTLETLVLPSMIQPVKSVVYIIKEELTQYPIFGPVAKARHPICVGRSNPREDLKIVMEEGKKGLMMVKQLLYFLKEPDLKS